MIHQLLSFRLGKTIQVIAFLSGMFDQELVKNAIIVAPKSLMENWCNEFEKWFEDWDVFSFNIWLLHFSSISLCMSIHTHICICFHLDIDSFSIKQNCYFYFRAPGIRLAQFHGAKAKREKELNKIQKRNGVILTTYGMLWSTLCERTISLDRDPEPIQIPILILTGS